jgi:uncharacterized protein
VRVTVRVHPGAPAEVVGGRYGDSEPPVLVVRVTARAVDGRATAAVLTALARAFGVARRDVHLVTGERSRTKVIEVSGGGPGALAGLLARSEG